MKSPQDAAKFWAESCAVSLGPRGMSMLTAAIVSAREDMREAIAKAIDDQLPVDILIRERIAKFVRGLPVAAK